VTVLEGKRDFFVRGLLVVCMALAFSYVGSAEAQLSKDDTKCINAMNKDYGKLASSIGKDIAACVKFKGKGKTDKLGPAPSTAKSCTTADVKGKVAKASGKVDSDYGKKCIADPLFGFTDTDTVKEAAWEAAIAMVGDIFGADLLMDPNTVLTAYARPLQGWDLDATLVLADKNVAGTKEMAGCQDAVIKAVFKCQDAYAKAYGKCTKDAIKPLPEDPSSMAACFSGLISDAKVAKSCNKIGDAIGKKCGGVDLKAAFPGCRGSSDLATCLTQSVDCRTCYALRKVDGLDGDAVCEGCLPVDPLPTNPDPFQCHYDEHAYCVGGDLHLQPCRNVPYSEQICWPAGQGLCMSNNASFFTTADSPPEGGAEMPVRGTMNMSFGPVDPGTGIATLEGRLDGPTPAINLSPLIGSACLLPGPDGFCDPVGMIDCDGGTRLTKDERFFHDLGPCGIADIGHDPNDTDPNNYTGPAECLATCEAKCDELTADPNFPFIYERVPTRSTCEGYCIGGYRHNLPCINDIACAYDDDPITPGMQWNINGLSGFCQGGEPVAHGYHCTCLCRGLGGPPGRPGALEFEVPLYTVVEAGPPCDGVEISMFNPSCTPPTTEGFQTTFYNMDFGPDTVTFPIFDGNPVMCQQIIDGNMELAYWRNLSTSIDSSSGDNTSATRTTCFKRSLGNYYDPNCPVIDPDCPLLDPNGDVVDPNSP
jgi:hypothetical protein